MDYFKKIKQSKLSSETVAALQQPAPATAHRVTALAKGVALWLGAAFIRARHCLWRVSLIRRVMPSALLYLLLMVPLHSTAWFLDAPKLRVPLHAALDPSRAARSPAASRGSL
jgi:hypothetical protein